MSYLSERILRLTKYLYPNGRAFRVPEGGVLERLHVSLNKSEEAAYLDATGILNTILPDNDLFAEDDALDWEVRLGITIRDGVSLEDRKAAILRKMNHPSDKFERAHFLFIQKQLQLAGFRVWVYENRFPDGGGGFNVKTLAHFVENYYNPQFTGTFQHGQIQHGQSQLFNAFEKVVNFLTNEEDENVDVPNGRQTFFIGGDEPGKFANVLPQRETEFRKVILQLKPVESAALLAIRYGDGLFDDLTTLTSPTAWSGSRRFILIGDRLYYQTGAATSIRVWNITTDAEIPGEQFGLGTLVNSAGLQIDTQTNKAYVSDVGGTEQVRVYNLQTNAEIPGENFGSGTLGIGTGDLAIYQGEAFVYDNSSGGNIYVFTISTGALDRTLPMNSTNINKITINDGRIYATQSGSPSLVRVFDLQGVESVPISEDISSPQGLTSENGYLYLCNWLQNRIEVYDIIRGRQELTTLGWNASSCFMVAVSDNNLVWSDGSNLFLRTRNT